MVNERVTMRQACFSQMLTGCCESAFGTDSTTPHSLDAGRLDDLDGSAGYA